MRAPEFWNQTHGRGAAPLSRALLTPISWLYAAVSRWRRAGIKPVQLPVPVICVGNVSLGGTGKTPLAMAIGKALLNKGMKPAFVLRGYGGRETGPLAVDPAGHQCIDVGDEALLLAGIANTFIGRNRVAAAELAVQQGADCIILDDGLQNPSLVKDLSIVVVDGPVGHGNGRVFPAGPLRERVAAALSRVDAMVIIGVPKPGFLDKNPFTGPVFLSHLQPVSTVPTGPLVAFAGIGRPQKFFSALRDAGAQLEQEIAFPDHHPYRPKDVVNLLGWKKGGVRLITTEKDLVRWPEEWRKDLLVWPVELVFRPPDHLDELLQRVVPSCM